MKFLSFSYEPSRWGKLVLGLVLPIILLLTYVSASTNAYEHNARQKLLPSFEKMGEASFKLAFTDDPRVGSPLVWVDTLASLERLSAGMALAAVFGLIIGVAIGMFPFFRAALNPLCNFIANVNPMAVLAILFMVFGTGGASKIALIVFGITPIIIATTVLAIEALPNQQLIKAATLNASQTQTISYLIVPQIMPNLINVVKANIGYAWVFIIAAESLAGSDGLGYRIALFKRKLALDSILPYVVWISMIGYAMIMICEQTVKRFYPWFNK